MSFQQVDRELLQHVKASVLVPTSSDASLEEVLEGDTERTALYFDERLRVLALLEVPTCPEEKLYAFLRKLEFRIDAWAVASQAGEEKSPIDAGPTRDLIASEPVPKLDDPFTLVKQSDDGEHVRLQLVWEVFVTLGRPRLRFLDQSIIFFPVATLVDSQDPQDHDGGFVEPFSMLEPSVLEPLQDIHDGEHRRMLTSRSANVVPHASKKVDTIRIQHQHSEPIRAHAAVMPRMRYNKINTLSLNPTTIASLDIEMTPLTDLHGTIETIDLSMASGKAICLMPDSLPMPCKSKDCITFLYDLQSAQQSGTATPDDKRSTSTSSQQNPSVNLNIDVLSVSILISLDLPHNAKATISTSWTTNVDFSLALNPAYGAPSQPLQRTNRPNSLNFTPYPDPTSKTGGRDRSSTSKSGSTSLQHQVIPATIPHQPLTSILSISFLAPHSPAKVREPFSWRVLIVNNSSLPVKLAIVPLPRIQRPTNATQHFAKRHAPKASNASVPLSIGHTGPNTSINIHTHRRQADGGSTAKAVVEDHIIYALHHQAPSAGVAAVPAEADLVSLTAELRIGPLGVGQCHETEISFIAYKAGVFNVDAIRVVDLAKEVEGGVGVINDIRELPEIVVVDLDDKETS